MSGSVEKTRGVEPLHVAHKPEIEKEELAPHEMVAEYRERQRLQAVEWLNEGRKLIIEGNQLRDQGLEVDAKDKFGEAVAVLEKIRSHLDWIGFGWKVEIRENELDLFPFAMQVLQEAYKKMGDATNASLAHKLYEDANSEIAAVREKRFQDAVGMNPYSLAARCAVAESKIGGGEFAELNAALKEVNAILKDKEHRGNGCVEALELRIVILDRMVEALDEKAGLTTAEAEAAKGQGKLDDAANQEAAALKLMELAERARKNMGASRETLSKMHDRLVGAPIEIFGMGAHDE